MNSIKPKQLIYQAVQEEIKSYIIENNLKPGDSLPPETELGQLFGVSRTSVREAVKSLETLGILQARPGTGLSVRTFSFDPLLNNLAYGFMFDLKDLKDVLEVRFQIEYGMIERALGAVTVEQIKQLKAILKKIKAAAELNEYSAEEDRAFHQTLWKNVDNKIVEKILDIFWIVFHHAQKRASDPIHANPIDTYRRHIPIVKALEMRDLKALRESMEQHYTGIQKRVNQMAKK